MKIRRLGAPLGAVVEDLDVRSVNDATWPEVNRLFCEYKVLVFRNQHLAPEEQMNFAKRWGPLLRHPYSGLKDFPDIIELENQGKLLIGECGVAADAGCGVGIQHRQLRWCRVVRHVRMPMLIDVFRFALVFQLDDVWEILQSRVRMP